MTEIKGEGMFDFNKKRNNKIVLWIIVGVLVLCMVLPLAYSMIAALGG